MENRVTGGAAGRLFVVSTPIGNMGDFSFRGVEVLSAVELILAEDTRHTRKLLQRYDIRTPTTAYHEHNEARATPELLQRLQAGADLALVTDAGTPLLSDPGARLVRAAAEAGVAVVPIPGASALLSALVASALDTERFTFFGFLPRKGKERTEALDEVLGLRHTSVLYEAPGRLVATLSNLAARGAGERPAVVAREMTKQFEEVRRGTVDDLRAYYENVAPRGEIVLMLSGAPEQPVAEEAVRDRARALLSQGASGRDAAAALVTEFGVPRNMAYRMVQEEE